MGNSQFLPRDRLQVLLDVLDAQGFRVMGPVVRDGAIQYLDIDDSDQLPRGITDQQSPGRYRLSKGDTMRCFAWANGPQALKPYLFSARETLWQSSRDSDGGLSFSAAKVTAKPLAVIGARACDLAALALHDRHFLDAIADPGYAARREGLFIVAVHCTHPAATCFCASSGDGPRATTGFDLALSEIDDGFLVETGTERGADIAARLPTQAAGDAQQKRADAEIEAGTARQVRQLPSRNLNGVLAAHREHPRWDQVAARCLACGNCTSVCPTCFCHAEHDLPTLEGDTGEHVREWDSCFSEGHAYLHGYQVRPEIRHRYRQWMTHKLDSWHEQFGRSGCVGCGRCITWCPVGIDITEEAQAICADAPDPSAAVAGGSS